MCVKALKFPSPSRLRWGSRKIFSSVKFSVESGSSIRIDQLRAPKVIKRGQQVTLLTGLNGLEVRIQGKALRDAAAGERVTVTNLSSGKQIEGTAHSDGTVSVP